MGRARFASKVVLSCSAVALLVAAAAARADREVAASRPTGPAQDGLTGVTPNDWDLTPAGRKSRVGLSPFGMLLAPDGQRLIVSNDGYGQQSLMLVDRRDLRVLQSIPYDSPQGLFIGLAASSDGRRLYASGGQSNLVHVYALSETGMVERQPLVLGEPRKMGFVTGLALSPDERTLYAANHLSGDIAVVDLDSGQVVRRVPLGKSQDPYDASLFPYGLVPSRSGEALYVSNWKEGTVAVLDTRSPRQAAVHGTIRVGGHPNAMILSPDGSQLFVANATSDSVSVIDTASSQVRATIDLRAEGTDRLGAAPNALALSPDGKVLYVVNAGENAVAVVDLADGDEDEDEDGEQRPRVRGRIPVGWYPTAIEVSRDGGTLYVANSKDVGLGQNGNPKVYVGEQMFGSVSAIAVPSHRELERLSAQVVRNRSLRHPERRDGVAERKHLDRTLPPIEHVVYVIKENRTYDQIFGDLPGGNGDPSLLLFDDRTAINHRRLAREFVLLDNTYCDAEISKDGHEWSMGANVTDYTQKVWPSDYSGRGTLINRALTAITNVPGGYLWDAAKAAGISYRSYGEYVINGKVNPDGTYAPATTRMPALADHFAPLYRTYDLKHKDARRADVWLSEFKGFEERGDFPALSIVSLPNDHLAGTAPGYPTPDAMMADNDLALGRIVDAISHSRFWGSTAIFVIEDDTQDGYDHVDSHRTPALVISPWVRRHSIDSTHYSTVSMVRTIEELLGLPALSLFDESARTLANVFAPQPDLTPFDHSVPAQSLEEMNPPLHALRGTRRALARRSQALALGEADAEDAAEANEILWRALKGKQPLPRRHVASR